MTDKPVQFGLRLPPEIHEELRRLSYETRQSMTAIIIQLIVAGLRKEAK